MDTRVKPEYDGDLMVDTRDTPEYDNRKRMCLKHENDHKRSLVKNLECIETAESGVDKVVSSCEKNPNTLPENLDSVRECAEIFKRRVQKEYTSAKISSRHQLNEFSLGRSMIEMLGVLAIIGVLSVGGIAGYSKAMMQFKINKTAEQISQIVTNLRTLYLQQKDFEGLDTFGAISMGIVPDDLDIDASRHDGSAIKNIFGGSVSISAHPATGFANYGKEFGAATISFYSIPTEACIALATMDWGSSSGLIALSIGGSSGFSTTGVYSGRGCPGESYSGLASACRNGSVVSLPMPVHIAAKACQGHDNSGNACVNFLFEK